LIEVIEAKTLDWRCQLFGQSGPGDSKIVLFLLDQTSLDHFEHVEGVTWPWPRDLYVAVLDFCRAGGARAVVFDVLFTSVSPCDPAFDDAFGRAQLARLPVPALLENVRWLGNTSVEPDSDGVFRRVPLLTRVGQEWLPSLPLAVAMAVTGEKRPTVMPGMLRLGRLEVPLDQGAMLVKFRRPKRGAGGERQRSYADYSLGNVVLAERSRENGEPPAVAPEELKDAIVFVGFSAPGLLDNRPTPVASIMPGVEINATAVDNILNNDHLVRAGPAINLALLLVAIALAGMLARLVRAALVTLLGVLALCGIVVAVVILVFRAGVWFDLATPLAGLVLSFAAASAYNYATEGRQRRFLRRVLSLYNSDDVVEEIIRDPSRLALGGERRDITVFFSDIAGFTTLSEALPAEDLVAMLRDYLDEMTGIILGEKGTVDKYIGDAIMAFWGAPLPAADHAVRGCRAALGNQRRLAELRARLAERGLPPIRCRIGLNSGEASVGNFGSTARFSYTAIGDNVNLASRLEGVNKAYHTELMISESTCELARPAVEVRALDLIRVKGKEQAIHVYELLALKGELTETELAPFRRFEEGFALYQAQRFAEAERLFTAVLTARPQDGPALVFIARCQRFAAEPPPPDWDGSYTMTEK
jgi:adenylate cyclase